MQFGPVALDRAEGAVLAHSMPVRQGRLRKGKLLGPEDVAALRAAGFEQVTVARLEAGDVPEDAAAVKLAQALAGPGLSVRQVGTGRANLLAAAAGLAQIDAEKVLAVNATDPAITVATVAPWQRMAARGMVATVKIIAYAVPEAALARACSAGARALALAEPTLSTATLIQTRIGLGENLAKGERVTAERLERLGVALAESLVVPHAEAPIAAALSASTGDLVLILTGSATSDARDVAPQALLRAGGRLEHFGMPVDPGNLSFLGVLGDRPVLGLPGSSRSPAQSGPDWVLERLICGVPVTARDIMAMGVGGLLKEPRSRPRPRSRRSPTPG